MPKQLTHPCLMSTQEALLALNEAVRIAQQHNDNVALAHALGALCQILATSAPSATVQLTDAAPALGKTTAHLSQLTKVLKRYGQLCAVDSRPSRRQKPVCACEHPAELHEAHTMLEVLKGS